MGNKALNLAILLEHGLNVPNGCCIPRHAYDTFIQSTGLAEQIAMELGRKPMEELRWEELWDASLRIRNLFLRTPLPPELEHSLLRGLAVHFTEAPTVVRSSAPGEDSERSSFAGLHESYVNVCGMDNILAHVRLVWASLWSDSALLYRRELHLDAFSTGMAVLVQTLVEGRTSGVIFSRNPDGGDEFVIEAVHGMNQGLVDGTIEPDQWRCPRVPDKATTPVHRAAERTHFMVLSPAGIERKPLPHALQTAVPLTDKDLEQVRQLSQRCESLFNHPQDTEWTFQARDLFVLQSRPVTTLRRGTEDERAWYQSLSRTFDNLQQLRRKAEQEIIPGMLQDAAAMAGTPLEPLDDHALGLEIGERIRRYQHWLDIYWTHLIPFAHGVRLFGQVYNDRIQPENPYEFVELLTGHDLQSVARNRAMQRLAGMIQQDRELQNLLRQNRMPEESHLFARALDAFLNEHGDLSSPLIQRRPGRPALLLDLLLKMAAHPLQAIATKPDRSATLTRQFLDAFPDDERQRAEELLDLAQASYRMRDDDNLYLQSVEMQMDAAVAEGRRRLQARGSAEAAHLSRDAVQAALGCSPVILQEHHSPATVSAAVDSPEEHAGVFARQLIGQPAGPGLAEGPATVIERFEDLAGFQPGDVLVCDAISPTMTFAVPLAAGIVERRGGMLIHGAIIAREYGIPCVTGVAGAVERIQPGTRISVDGYLGIVRILQEETDATP